MGSVIKRFKLVIIAWEIVIKTFKSVIIAWENVIKTFKLIIIARESVRMLTTTTTIEHVCHGVDKDCELIINFHHKNA